MILFLIYYDFTYVKQCRYWKTYQNIDFNQWNALFFFATFDFEGSVHYTCSKWVFTQLSNSVLVHTSGGIQQFTCYENLVKISGLFSLFKGSIKTLLRKHEPPKSALNNEDF